MYDNQPDLFDLTPNRPRLVVLDSHLLLLYVTGLVDADSITDFARTRQYSKEDFHLLTRALGQFREIVTTPNILTETTNLAKDAPEPLRKSLFAVLQRLISEMSEEYLPSQELCRADGFVRVGLTDVGIAELANDHEPEVLVLTADLGLYEYAWDKGSVAVNFTHYMARNL